MTRDDWDMTGMTRIEWHTWVPGKTRDESEWDDWDY